MNMVPPIAICGAGPSGLTLACLLEKAGIEYIVFDRDIDGRADVQGGSLDIHGDSGQLALRQAGLWDQFVKVARYDDQRFKIVDQDDNVIVDVQQDGHAKEGKESRPEVDRKALRALLLSGVPSSKIKWNHCLDSVCRGGNGEVEIKFKDGTTVSGFKLVVGADGSWSKARHLVTSASPEYSGLTYIQTIISTKCEFHAELVKEVGSGTCMAVGDGKQITTQRLGDGSYNIYIGLRLPEHWKKCNDSEHLEATIYHLVEEKFKGWAPNLLDRVRKHDAPFYIWPLYAMPVSALSWSSVPGVTLIGDAAHVSTPFAGEGVNCSMHDALHLASAITEFGVDHLDTAVAKYERQMFPIAIEMISSSAENGEMMFSQDGGEKFREMLGRYD